MKEKLESEKYLDMFLVYYLATLDVDKVFLPLELKLQDEWKERSPTI